MNNIKQEINEVLDKIVGDDVILNKIKTALDAVGDYKKQFIAQWSIANAFFNLGNKLSTQEAVQAGRFLLQRRPDELGCKFTYTNLADVPMLIILGEMGHVILSDNEEVIIGGGYATSNLDVILAKEGESLNDTLKELLLHGLPFMGLFPLLDRMVADNQTESDMNKVHERFRSYLK